MTKATASQPTGSAPMNFTDPKDQSTVMVGKVQPKEADRPASGKRHQRAAAPATTEQLSKLMAHFQK